MATIKSYTDLEQSKRLAEILPIKSADMGWNVFVDNTTRILPIDDWDLSKNSGGNLKFYPAWSLAALLAVLPKGTRLLKSATDDTYHCDYPKGNIDKWFDNPIDAAFEIVCWLKENEKL